MNAEPLVRAILAATLLLEDCRPEEVNPDTAVRGLENIAYELLMLTGADRSEFLDLLRRMESTTDDPREAQWLRSLPFSIGMVEEPS